MHTNHNAPFDLNFFVLFLLSSMFFSPLRFTSLTAKGKMKIHALLRYQGRLLAVVADSLDFIKLINVDVD